MLDSRIILFLLAVSASAAKADNLAYMSTNTGEFGTIDLNTGAFTELAAPTGVPVAGMAVLNGTLYASSYDTTGSGTLYTVNPANGSLTVVGTSSISYASFGSAASSLYALGVDGNLYSINPNSGAATTIGPTGFVFGDGAWAGLSNNATILYFSNGENLFTLNTTTGAKTLVGNMGAVQMGVLLMEGGILYGGQNVPSFAVAKINPTTGAATTGPGVTGATGEFYALAPVTQNTAYMGTITGDFGTINLNTGAFSLLGNTGVTLAGMAVANGTLYGSSYETGSGTLYTINPTNGSLTVVGTSPTNFWGFGSTTSGLYVVGLDFNLYSIDPASGAATLIGPTGLSLSGGLWYGVSTNSSTLYFSAGPNFYTLDTATGAATLVGSTGGPQMGAMLLEGGILYGGEDSPALAVATLNPTTGAATTGPAVTGTTGIVFALAPYPLPTATVTLNPSTMPSAGDPGVTTLTVTGTGFPIGTIPPANVTVTFNPTTAGGGPSGTAAASMVTVVSGSTESVTFRIPTTIGVSTPTSYQVSIAGTNSTGNAFQSGNTAALTIDPALAIITSSPLQAGTVNVNYSQALVAAGGSGSYSWSITAGTLPGGLSLDTSTGAIGGLPSAAGTSNFNIQVTDSNLATAAKAFALTIDPALAITTSSPLPAGQVNVSYSQAITATGGSGQYTWEVSVGALPNGLGLNTASGLISGLPGTAGTSDFTIQVTDSNQATAAKAFALSIDRMALITTVSPNWGNVSAQGGGGGPTLPVTITGAHTNFVQGSTQASFGPGVSVGNAPDGQPGPVTVNSPTSATAQLAISVTAAAGPRTVTVITGAEEASLVNGFTIFPAVPRLTLLHSFASPLSGGAYPNAGLAIGSGGVLFGTTAGGGTGNGTVFSLTPPPAGGNWTEAVLHSFTGFPSDGTQPEGDVAIDSSGVLYSTTYAGGSQRLGTVFSLTPPASPGGAWTETVLHNFAGGSDGANLYAGVAIGSGGVLYGTTVGGGTGTCSSGCGTVFSLTPPTSPGGSWAEAILHNFAGGDGANPHASVVIGSGGVLYGTTAGGGTSGKGTVFMLTPPGSPDGAWVETVLHNFTGRDGANVLAPVVIGSGGVLFGATLTGGTSGKGTVFMLKPPGTPGGVWSSRILNTFMGSPNDGANPDAGLAIGEGGVLYGTTQAGGSANVGTVFSVTPPATPGGFWSEAVLHSFIGPTSDGEKPHARLLVDSTGLLYGTTSNGGADSQPGTVFSLTP